MVLVDMRKDPLKKDHICLLCDHAISGHRVFNHFYNNHYFFWKANQDHLEQFVKRRIK